MKTSKKGVLRITFKYKPATASESIQQKYGRDIMGKI